MSDIRRRGLKVEGGGDLGRGADEAKRGTGKEKAGREKREGGTKEKKKKKKKGRRQTTLTSLPRDSRPRQKVKEGKKERGTRLPGRRTSQATTG